MSLAMRDCTSPVWVRVKNASDMRWRCAYTAARRSCMTRWPTLLESQVCTTPIAPLATDDAIMPSTSRVSRVVSFCGIAVSRIPRSRNGLTTPMPADSTISPSRIASRGR